jgi:hypothetical protein
VTYRESAARDDGRGATPAELDLAPKIEADVTRAFTRKLLVLLAGVLTTATLALSAGWAGWVGIAATAIGFYLARARPPKGTRLRVHGGALTVEARSRLRGRPRPIRHATLFRRNVLTHLESAL